MRPGLWEISTTSPLLALVPQIPPDQLASLRQLARQHGIEVPQLSNGTAVAQVCVTAEMAQHDVLPDLNQSQAGCSSRNARREGDHYSLDVVCNSDRISGQGRAQGTLTSPESFVGTSEFSGLVQGMPVDQQAQTTGHWRGANCGNLRPPH
ncbi:MAG: DUF3617 domain-containing protein [Burkholderiaceae bacterium]